MADGSETDTVHQEIALFHALIKKGRPAGRNRRQVAQSIVDEMSDMLGRKTTVNEIDSLLEGLYDAKNLETLAEAEKEEGADADERPERRETWGRESKRRRASRASPDEPDEGVIKSVSELSSALSDAEAQDLDDEDEDDDEEEDVAAPKKRRGRTASTATSKRPEKPKVGPGRKRKQR